MLMPKKVKYRKQQRGRMTGKAWRGSQLAFGDFGLKVLEPGWITDRQIEAARVAMTRFIKRGGKIQIRLFPDKPVTKKPAETRMGKGKGAPEAAARRAEGHRTGEDERSRTGTGFGRRNGEEVACPKRTHKPERQCSRRRDGARKWSARWFPAACTRPS